MTIYNQDGNLDVYHYSVSYDTNGGAFEKEPNLDAYYFADTVTAIADVPTRDGYRFLGWKYGEGELIQPGETVTQSIETPITLTAQWEKTVNVKVNVTIKHEGGDGYDQMETKDDLFMALVSRVDSSSPYLEVEGKN